MSVKRFKFVSPGVFINEIDNSQLPKEPERIGPAIIGRLERGPAMRPVTVGSFSEFVETFGNPIAGGLGGDTWREGNYLAPTYAAYAAQAYLRNSGPVTVVRVLGEPSPDATAAGYAGWTTDNSHVDHCPGAATGSGGAYGLFVFSSGSAKDYQGSYVGAPSGLASTLGGPADPGRSTTKFTGSLAAVWYFDNGAIELSGALLPGVQMSSSHALWHNSPGAVAANGVALRAGNASTLQFSAVLFNNSSKGKKVTFNFDRTSDNYIRKVFNTNPTLCGNTNAIKSKESYFLGETFDRFVRDINGSTELHTGETTSDASSYGLIVPLASSAHSWHSNKIKTQRGKSGWVFSQDLTTNTGQFDGGKQQNLFRFVALDDGEWSSKHIKVSVSDLRAPTDVDPYGSFTITLRRSNDTDAAPRILEKYSNCNLNPNSSNYIALKIGDQYQEWDENQNRYRVYGNYANQSRFLRVVMNEDVDQGLVDAALLPFGFYGPIRYKTFHCDSSREIYQVANPLTTQAQVGQSYHAGNVAENALAADDAVLKTDITGSVVTLLPVANLAPFKGSGGFNTFLTSSTYSTKYAAGFVGIPKLAKISSPGAGVSGSILYPSLALRVSSSDKGISDEKKCHFGIDVARQRTSTRFDESYYDITRGGKGYGADGAQTDTSSHTEHSFIFTLDDLCTATTGSGANVKAMFYQSGSRKAGLSYTAARSGWTDLIDSDFTKFTMPIVGGFDGLDVKEREPFGNHIIGSSTATFKSSGPLHSLKRAIDSLADPEVVEVNAVSVPGVRVPLVTNHLMNVCEDRADALAVIDIEDGGYTPSTETTKSFKTRITDASVVSAVSKLKQRGLNTSYACAYFPWVKIYDEINDKQVWVPPSVVAIGTFGSVERNSELWFAPAGFTRGGLSEGSAGLPVISVSQRLSSKDRDRLYDQNINPIATFPAEGIVIFGQKTLQATQSALDRINVRRLMIFVKKEISRIASRLLFDQNVSSTWNRFRGQVEPFLDSVKARLGLTDFKVVLDETTTTPDLIDRNIMYAKIFLKPARAIEFIAIDFVITNTGASFED